MDIFATWNNLHKNKLEWAYKARDEFYNSIKDKDVKDIYMKANKEIYVCVYGRSQVGKTTLILKLIGIKEEYIKKVSDILRGKRNIGNSATITATIYTISEDNYFYYEEVKGKVNKCTEETIQDVLKDLRSRACSIGVNTNSIKIAIPKKYFEEEKNKKPINIIDLPGVESDDLSEYEHIEKIVRKFVPISNMILLIERADQVAYLQKLSLPGIDCWYDDVDRFKVILTRSVSNNSTKNEILSKLINNKKEYVEIFEKDIIKDNKEIKLKDRMVYPLEYGESWDELKKKEKEIVLKISPIFESLYKDLEDDIINSQNEYSKLMMSMQMHNRIEKNIINKKAKYKQDIEEAKNESNHAKRKVGEFNDSIDMVNDEKDDFLKSLSSLKEIEKITINSYKNNIDEPYEKNTVVLINYVQEITMDCVDEYSKLINRINGKFRSLNIPQSIRNSVLDIVSEETSGILYKLNDYFLETYFRDSKFQADKYEIRRAISNANERIVKKIQNERNKIISIYSKEYYNQIEELERQEKVFQIKKKNEENKIDEFENTITLKERELESYIERSKKDLMLSREYLKFLYKGYHREYDDIKELIESKKTKRDEKFINLMYLYLISDELSKLEGTLK